jgi:hypothetical protein
MREQMPFFAHLSEGAFVVMLNTHNLIDLTTRKSHFLAITMARLEFTQQISSMRMRFYEQQKGTDSLFTIIALLFHHTQSCGPNNGPIKAKKRL